MSALLRVLLRLHDAGAVHRDLTAKNVMVMKEGTLKLGDFGIARHRFGRRPVRADAFNPGLAPSGIADGTLQSWKAADDVYQMGMILLAALVAGTSETKPDARAVKGLDCSPWMKGIIQRAIGLRHKRFPDRRRDARGD